MAAAAFALTTGVVSLPVRAFVTGVVKERMESTHATYGYIIDAVDGSILYTYK